MKIERAEGLAWRRIDGETFVVDLRRKWMYGLNHSAGVVWQAVVDGAGVETAVRRLLLDPAPGAPESVLRSAVVAFLLELADLGLLRVEDAEAPQAFGTLRGDLYPGAPALTWREELRAFAQSCTQTPFNCQDQVPLN